MTDSKPLWQWTAQEIASATRAGKLSASEATERLTRIAANKNTEQPGRAGDCEFRRNSRLLA